MAKVIAFPPQKESVIKAHIYQFLSLQLEFFGWVETSTGIWDPKTARFRKRNGTGMRCGVADLVGIWNGRGLALEIKTSKGRLSDMQIIFLSEFQRHGGVSAVLRSLADADLLIDALRFKQPLPTKLTPFP